MKGMNVEVYRKLANVKDIINLFGPRILIAEMGEDEIIDAIGMEKFIRRLGEEKVIRTIGKDRLRELLDRMEQEQDPIAPTPNRNDSPNGHCLDLM